MPGVSQTTRTPRAPSDATRVPAAAIWLGAAGALPFATGALLAMHGPGEASAFALHAVRAYGAAILAFMGGIHWGLGIGGTERAGGWIRLSWSVVPALVAWGALLLPERPGLLLLALAFVLLLAGDLIAVRRGGAPSWYPRLRWPLTAVVVPALLLAASA